jgi:phosphoglycerate dehydrogenase-like enzyme
MNVLAYDPYMDEAYAETNGIASASLEEVVAQADFLSLHLPFNEQTRNILDMKAMRSMKPGAIIVNTARGGLIDEDAACELLKAGHLGGLGLDAYAKEPPEASPLFELENVVLTPHTGSHTPEAVANMAGMSVDNLIDVLSGKPCKYIVNA